MEKSRREVKIHWPSQCDLLSDAYTVWKVVDEATKLSITTCYMALENRNKKNRRLKKRAVFFCRFSYRTLRIINVAQTCYYSSCFHFSSPVPLFSSNLERVRFPKNHMKNYIKNVFTREQWTTPIISTQQAIGDKLYLVIACESE